MDQPKTRITDTALWLHNKLGASNDLWSGGSICSQLNQEVLVNIKECFHTLQSQVKLKLVLSFLHIPLRNLDEWKQELDDILELALEDQDQWVSMVAELLKKYPRTRQINFDIEHNSAVFTDLVGELKKILKKHANKNILPLECMYLNKNALQAVVGHLPQPTKHFTLKRKSKSAALRAELLQKSSEAAANAKKSAALLASMAKSRGISDSGPLKGIPKIGLPSGSFKAPIARTVPRAPVKKDGGIKILDIADQPFGRDAKRKKKNPEEKEEKTKEEVEATVTPDYAAGLTSTIPPSPAPFIATETAKHKQQPHPQQQQNVKMPESPALPPILRSGPPPAPVPSAMPGHLPVPSSVTVTPLPPTPIIITQNQPPAQHVIMNPSQINVEKRLTLSKEQMAEAQEMFRNSNRVSRPEKALILGFMAGSRDNPCPNLGNVVTIKLNEQEGDVQQQDGSIVRCMIETHYQMNYVTGEGKRINKYVRINPF